MRAQYFRLDPFIRGRCAYHRLGNIVGKYVKRLLSSVLPQTPLTERVTSSGLVTFEYPQVNGQPHSEVEIIGAPESMESLEARISMA